MGWEEKDILYKTFYHTRQLIIDQESKMSQSTTYFANEVSVVASIFPSKGIKGRGEGGKEGGRRGGIKDTSYRRGSEPYVGGVRGRPSFLLRAFPIQTPYPRLDT